jgi:hypothetical protein
MAENGNGRPGLSKAARILLLVGLYYVVVLLVGYSIRRVVPHTTLIPQTSLDNIFGVADQGVVTKKGLIPNPLDQSTLAVTAALAMIGSVLLVLPVIWVYTLTRAKRGYSQSVVHMLVILPLVVAGVVVLVKYSTALAFSLAGIVAAVRFRNTLEDSKDAVYVFLASGIGLAAATDLPVAAVISILFNIVIVTLWYTDFGHAPVELEGRVAERRLERSRQLRKTGTFVAKVDETLLEGLTAEQLEGVARRAWRRARENEAEIVEEPTKTEGRLKVRSPHLQRTRDAIESRLDDIVKKWKLEAVSTESDGSGVVEYNVTLKKKEGPDALKAFVRATAPEVTDVSLN